MLLNNSVSGKDQKFINAAKNQDEKRIELFKTLKKNHMRQTILSFTEFKIIYGNFRKRFYVRIQASKFLANSSIFW